VGKKYIECVVLKVKRKKVSVVTSVAPLTSKSPDFSPATVLLYGL
jgi:hypothetical protein